MGFRNYWIRCRVYLPKPTKPYGISSLVLADVDHPPPRAGGSMSHWIALMGFQLLTAIALVASLSFPNWGFMWGMIAVCAVAIGQRLFR